MRALPRLYGTETEVSSFEKVLMMTILLVELLLCVDGAVDVQLWQHESILQTYPLKLQDQAGKG